MRYLISIMLVLCAGIVHAQMTEVTFVLKGEATKTMSVKDGTPFDYRITFNGPSGHSLLFWNLSSLDLQDAGTQFLLDETTAPNYNIVWSDLYDRFEDVGIMPVSMHCLQFNSMQGTSHRLNKTPPTILHDLTFSFTTQLYNAEKDIYRTFPQIQYHLSVSVPEPSSFVLFLIGSAFLGLSRSKGE